MRKARTVEETIDGWWPVVDGGGEVVIEQSRVLWIGYLALAVVMTVVAVIAFTSPENDITSAEAVTVAAVLGVIFFGFVGIPLFTWRILRGAEPRVRLTATTVTVGQKSLELARITGVRGHNGAYEAVPPERSGGVSVFVGEEHALEIPLPPSVPTGAVIAMLLHR